MTVGTLVPAAPTAEIDLYFDTFDIDAGGTLDNEELRACLLSLQAAAKVARREEALLAARAALLRLATRVVQDGVAEGLAADEAAVAAEAAAESAAAEAAERAKAEARQSRVAAKAERDAKAAEEKAAFEAKIEANRARKKQLE